MIALVVAYSAALRDGLCAWLSTIPEIGIVSSAHDLSSALGYVKVQCPSLVLLEIDRLDAEVLSKIESMVAACPQTKILALVNHSEAVPSLQASGVDAVLMQGTQTEKLTQTVAALLGSNNDRAE